jgi:hypothetical protein
MKCHGAVKESRILALQINELKNFYEFMAQSARDFAPMKTHDEFSASAAVR